ncbi:aldose epimerase family protein [Colwellia echini]|uniref:Aldose 1-epimerase n=1 Tax=Colwellia echini TaxID=1982103 RepID=A0ABY3N1X6_9GAMM|nr:aldose epimerase family protein [Colwellia echini]TYK67237.1 galactose mutarotase [Colwellia echini]
MSELRTTLLQNNKGMSVEILSFGARIKSILFPVKGKTTEMTVGYSTAEGYLTDEFYLGATCGRVCNRIEDARFELGGVHYFLTKNDNENCLHGGIDNFSSRYWQIQSFSKSAVTLITESKDGDQGFPGNLTLQVEYHLTDDNKLEINYLATTDAPTPINITNHAYFNLGDNSCESLDLELSAASMLERKDNSAPSGVILPVENSDFDFRQVTNIGQRQANFTDVSLQDMACFDHCYIFDSKDNTLPKATLISKNNAVKMSLYTDQPAMQLYTGRYLEGNFIAYQGVCLEAQGYSNAVNTPHFPTSILQVDEQYQRQIVYHFESTEVN